MWASGARLGWEHDPGTRQSRARSSAVATIQQRIDVTVPVRTAYDQWTQFKGVAVGSIAPTPDHRTHGV